MMGWITPPLVIPSFKQYTPFVIPELWLAHRVRVQDFNNKDYKVHSPKVPSGVQISAWKSENLWEILHMCQHA